MRKKAKKFAIEVHDCPEPQRYGSALYSKHLTDVNNVREKYKYYLKEEDQEDVEAAIWLHDTVEDTCITPSKLAKLFNIRVADIVYRVSNELGFDRKETNFKTWPKIWPNDLAIFVKLCDRIANTTNSKFGDDVKSSKMYNTYTEEYIMFRAALKVRNLYEDMWRELDFLNKH